MEDFFKDKKGFWWALLYELLLTFSSKPSFFAAKRIERNIMFNIAMWIIVGYVIRRWYELTTDQILMIVGLLLAGGAFNAVQIRKDLKQDKTQTNEN